jgi:uncharacterized membrane protein
MIRPKEKIYKDQDPDFQWRGQDVTRIENLSDIVFALSFGLLVTASTPPQTYDGLLSLLSSFPSVAFAMAILFMIWNFHFVYFRRYGLVDKKIISLNSVLLFLVIFFAYPLKFMADVMLAAVLAIFGYFEPITSYRIDFAQTGELLALYSLVYAAIFLVIYLMYRHAFGRAEVLELTSAERKLTKAAMLNCLVQVIFGVVVAIITKFSPLGPWAGFIYMLIGPTIWVVDKRSKA